MKKYLFLSICCLFTFGLVAQDETKTIEVPQTEMSFDEPEFIFGQIIQGESIQNVFEFTNTGDEPLIIKSAKGSCGCTVPEFPKEPIMPGETGQFLVQFNSKGKKGIQNKRVTIVANTNPSTTYLTIKGEVLNTQSIAKIAPELKSSKRSLDKKADVNSISIFPNPTSDILNVDLKEHMGKSAFVAVYDRLGKVMESQRISEITSDVLQLDIQNYVSGTYSVTVKVNGLNRIAKQFNVVR